jgi:hypothetical protein
MPEAKKRVNALSRVRLCQEDRHLQVKHNCEHKNYIPLSCSWLALIPKARATASSVVIVLP